MGDEKYYRLMWPEIDRDIAIFKTGYDRDSGPKPFFTLNEMTSRWVEQDFIPGGDGKSIYVFEEAIPRYCLPCRVTLEVSSNRSLDLIGLEDFLLGRMEATLYETSSDIILKSSGALRSTDLVYYEDLLEGDEF
ncbi:MAG: hypothetical protein Q8P81_02485 [Nanoarchaeota archaeon]|nr:hypothetical protein [Nanoarchaeota archaeon]